MLKRNFLLLFFAAIAMVLGIACTPKPSNMALVIILGRHANAKEFSSEQYENVERRIKNAAYGGYVRLIIGGGKPISVNTDQYVGDDEDIEMQVKGETMEARREKPTSSGYYGANAYVEAEREVIKSYNAQEIMNFIKDPRNMAKYPENDLLEAIRMAKTTLSNIQDDANRAKRPLKRLRILIMDTGMVTAGNMDFSNFDLDGVDFTNTEDVEKKAEEIASLLEKNLALKGLDLKDFNNKDFKETDSFLRIRFLGLGDVAYPQAELTHQQKMGLKTIWDTVLEKCNVRKHEIRYIETGEPDSPPPSLDFLLPVSTIEFGSPVVPRVLPVYFEFAKDTYVDREKTKRTLGDYYNHTFKRRLSGDPALKLYIVGAECKIGYRSRELSNKRALAVKNSLANLGVSPDRMVSFGLGIDDPWRTEEDPYGTGNYVEAIAEKNRKVMFFFSNNHEFVKKAEEARAKTR